jgi:hypothetical protein
MSDSKLGPYRTFTLFFLRETNTSSALLEVIKDIKRKDIKIL